MKKKVIYIISLINKSVGFEWVAERLSRDKIDLSFILLNEEPSYLARFLKSKGINTIELKYGGKKDILKVAGQLSNILRKNKPDIIHTHLVDADLIGQTVGWLHRIDKRIYTRHNSNFHRKYHGKASFLEKLNNRLSTDIVSISQNISDILIEEENISPDKVTLVHHGFDLSLFDKVNQTRINHLKERNNLLDKTGPVIGVVSRYMHWKGIHFIIPAFEKILKKYPNAHLVLANAKKGDYKQEIALLLENLPKNNFTEIEFENDLFALYKMFDVFVHVPIDPEVEAFGQIYVESLAARIPSIFTLSGVAREFIEHEQNALVVDFENSEQIYHSILRVLKDEQLRESLKRNGRNSVTGKFELDRMIQKLENLYLA